MTVNLRRRVFIDHPSVFFPALATALAIPALSTGSFVPLSLLVSSLLVYSKIIAHRRRFVLNTLVAWIGVTVGGTISHASASFSAVSHSTDALAFGFTSSLVFSFLALLFISLDKYNSQLSTPWAKIALFPALWSTGWQLVAQISPIGHLMTWSPVQGIDAYAWTKPVFGPWAINWIVAASAVVAAEVAGSWFIGSDESSMPVYEPHDLLSDASPAPSMVIEPRRGSWHVLSLAGCLFALVIPSYFISPTPPPPHSVDSTPLVAGCILPVPEELGGDRHLSTFEHYLQETKRHVDDARVDILVWPESAVRFESQEDRDAKFAAVQEITHGSYVAVSFEEPAPAGHRQGTRRNGVALVGPKGVVFEYYKRNLVPLVESFPLSSSADSPTIYEVELRVGRNGKERRKIPITASICLDFASPRALSGLPSRPALVLAPARTWENGVSKTMWGQTRARAEETGSLALFCDGGADGVSGFTGPGVREITQVGPGSWTRAVGVDWPFDEQRTFYSTTGDWTMFAIVWGVAGVGWGFELAAGPLARRLLGNRHRWRDAITRVTNSIPRIPRLPWRSREARGEEQPLLT